MANQTFSLSTQSVTTIAANQTTIKGLKGDAKMVTEQVNATKLATYAELISAISGITLTKGNLPRTISKRVREDLTTDGGSKVKFAEAIRTAGAECAHTLVLFYYDIFEGSTRRLADNGLQVHYRATGRDVLTEARAGGHFDKKTLDAVGEFLADPLAWSAANGGISEL